MPILCAPRIKTWAISPVLWLHATQNIMTVEQRDEIIPIKKHYTIYVVNVRARSPGQNVVNKIIHNGEVPIKWS